MYRAALRSSSGATLRHAARAPTTTSRAAGRRLASSSSSSPTPPTPGPTPKPKKKRGDINWVIRWGLALGSVYYYNTLPAFADEPQPATKPAPAQFSEADLPTVEAVVAQKRKEAEQRQQKQQQQQQQAASPAKSETQEDDAAASASAPAPSDDAPQQQQQQQTGGAQALEDEAGQQGAFNPETGEINWDCPCLGGMADGPCGDEFKAAFSCFVYSQEEPKGMDCIEKFQHMQDCFRQHPEVYGDEIADDEAAEPSEAKEAAPASDAIADPVQAAPEQERKTGESVPDRTRDATEPTKP